MRVFVAGATGAIGCRLVPQFLARGHQVVGTYRSSADRATRLRSAGAEIVPLDLLDADATRRAVSAARPDVIVHEATALPGLGFSRKLDKTFARTNQLRIAGTDALLTAASAAGVQLVVAQSFAPYRYARRGGMVKTEDDALDSSPPKGAHETNAAMAYLDRVVSDFGGTVLRYGGFYGDPDDRLVRMVRKRRYPMIDDGAMMKMVYAMDRRTTGKITAPIGVFAARMPIAFGSFYGKISRLDKKLKLARPTAIIIREQVASINECLFCMDAARWFALKESDSAWV